MEVIKDLNLEKLKTSGMQNNNNSFQLHSEVMEPRKVTQSTYNLHVLNFNQ